VACTVPTGSESARRRTIQLRHSSSGLDEPAASAVKRVRSSGRLAAAADVLVESRVAEHLDHVVRVVGPERRQQQPLAANGRLGEDRHAP
jgi:hypothetical protein